MSNENIWADIDQHVASLVGQRVYFNDPAHGKCLAFVTKAGYERNAEGQISNTLLVFPPSGSPYNVTAALSSDRRVGSFDIAKPGDLTDSGSTPRPEPVVEEGNSGVDTGTPGAKPPSNTQAGQPPVVVAPNQEDREFDPADLNKDGVVTPKEQKRFDKENR